MKARSALVFFGIAMGLLAAEICCRAVIDWLPTSTLRPSSVLGLNYEGKPYARSPGPPGTAWEYQNNRWGMRGPDFPLEKAPKERRLLILGDSIAAGAGVELDSISARIIEKEINRRLRDGTTLRVINSGISSYNAWDYYFTLQGKGWQFKPDGVLLFLCMNDAAPKALALPLIAPGAPLPAYFRLKHFLLKSRLIYFLLYKANVRNRVADIWNRFFRPTAVLPGDAGSEDVVKTLDPESVEAIKRNTKIEGWSLESMKDAFQEMFQEKNWLRALAVLAAIHQATREKGVFFKVVIFPVGLQVPPGYRDERPQRIIRKYLAEHGIEYVDLLEPYRRATLREGRIFTPGDLLHPNAIGHRIAAQEIMRVLEKEYYLRP